MFNLKIGEVAGLALLMQNTYDSLIFAFSAELLAFYAQGHVPLPCINST